MNTIVGIPSLKDNYIWVIHRRNNAHIVVVDPGEAAPVLTYLNDHNLVLDAILLTHHHHDHTGGVLELLNHFPSISVYGSLKDKVPGITQFVKEGETVDLKNQNLTLNVIDVPGHTQGHIAYYNNDMLFCGDTLFSVGCGKIFEGTAIQMYQSLTKLKQLEPETKIYCAHEYTLSNIKFAKTIDPMNEALERRHQEVLSLRKKALPSLPVTLATEIECNPFLRCEESAIQQAVEHHYGKKLNDSTAVFAHLRKWKNDL